MARAPRSDAQRNRQRLIDAAAEIFTAAGVGAPLESVATRADVSIGTLYNHFGDRHGLINAALGDAMQKLIANADVAATIDDPWAAFEALITGTCELQSQDRAIADILGSRYTVTGPIDDACTQSDGHLHRDHRPRHTSRCHPQGPHHQ